MKSLFCGDSRWTKTNRKSLWGTERNTTKRPLLKHKQAAVKQPVCVLNPLTAHGAVLWRAREALTGIPRVA